MINDSGSNQIIPTMDPTAQETDGIVGTQLLPDGQNGAQRLGSQGEIITNDMNGFFFEQIMRGNGYVWTTALAGQALIVPASGAVTNPTLFNPPNSGRLIVLQKICFGRTAKATPTEGAIVYATNTVLGSTLAGGAINDIGVGGTTLPINVSSAALIVAGNNLRLGLNDQSGVYFIPTGVNSPKAAVIFGNSGIAQTADNGATTVEGPQVQLSIDYINGLIVVPPGNIFQVCAAAAAPMLTTYTISIYGISIPNPVLG